MISMKELLLFIAQSLVEHPEDVTVDETQTEYGLVLDLHVNENEMGKVIGKQGKIAKAILIYSPKYVFISTNMQIQAGD